MAVQPKYIRNENGPALGTVSAGVLKVDGKYFKDLAGTGKLLPYEDWRLAPRDRAKDLAARLSVRELLGLMMFSPHQMVPFAVYVPGFLEGTYDGKPFPESQAEPWALTDQQKAFLKEDGIRHVTLANVQSPQLAARWNNEMQAYAEQLPYGIPVNNCSDPRHGAGDAATNPEYKMAGSTSKWPEGLGIAATFDPALCKQYGQIVAKDYRSMGITTALSPQIDLGTEPRWMRIEDTFGTDPALVADLARAYCDGLQTTQDAPVGWGKDSVAAMAKHWPGGGPCEAGRDAHYPFGKYAVHPGGQLEAHLKPFVEGAFRLDGPTKSAASVMPYYTVSWDVDDAHVGNAYSHHIITELLREQYGFDGVVCTDWRVAGDPAPVPDSIGGPCYGAEALTPAQRHLRLWEAGVDQFGGDSDLGPILVAYELGCETYGEATMRKRIEESAVRILTNSFRCGLFENPYLDPEETAKTVGCPESRALGFETQVKSVVMLKNQGALPVQGRKKVYIPGRHIEARKNFMRMPMPPADIPGANREVVEEVYDWAETPQEADFALVFIESPLSDGFDGEKGYQPVTLQYRPYTADTARAHSLAGDPGEDRGYRGRTNRAYNEHDLDLVRDTKAAMAGKPVIVCIRMHNPCVLAELEPYADAILVDFGVQTEAILTIVSGEAEPSGMLPVQLPADMNTVERHCEDKPFDMTPYTDSAGNTYDYGYGLNWSGVIRDDRTVRYKNTRV